MFGKKNKRKQDKYNNSRINTVVAIIFLLGGAILYKLYHIQILNYDLYTSLAKEQHEVSDELNPTRGRIFIHDKSTQKDKESLFPIATNKDFALVYAVPKKIKEPEKTAEILYELFDKNKVESEVDELFEESLKNEINDKLSNFRELDDEELLEKKKEIISTQTIKMSNKEYVEFMKIKREAEINLRKNEIVDSYAARLKKENDPYEPIARKVGEKMLKKIMDMNLEGIDFLMQKSRYYPEDEITSHVTGFFGHNLDNSKGLYGLEGFFDEELTGKIGLIKAERDAKGNVIIINDMEYKKAIDGSDLVLTIDRSIQFTACNKLKESIMRHGADGGTVIIMEPKTGEIMAMCSYPSFDPNKYEEVENITYFNNPAIFSQYEPGSVFKTITMAAAIDQGAVSPKTTYFDKGSVLIEGWPKPIKNSDFETHGGHGESTMSNVLELSLNTGVIFAMKQIGDKKFAEYIENFGFGEKTGIELETEAPGNISNLKRKKIRPVDAAVSSFGQGITVTPLQMVTAYAVIANNGILVKPFLVKEIVDKDGNKIETKPREIKRVISERTALLVSGMLVNVIERGHARHAAVEGYYVAGKTGTAQVADSKKKGYSDKTIHNFVGFAPVEDPKFVMLVKLDDPKDVHYSSSSAAPLFGDIAKFLLTYLDVAKERKR